MGLVATPNRAPRGPLQWLLSGRAGGGGAAPAPALPTSRLLDGLYHRPELGFSSLAPLTPMLDNGTDKAALWIDTSQGVDVTADGDTRTFTGLGSNLITNPDFASATGWTLGTGTSIGSSVLTFSGAGFNAEASQTVLTAGEWIYYDITVDSVSDGVLSLIVGNAIALSPVTAGRHIGAYYVPTGASDTDIGLQAKDPGGLTSAVISQFNVFSMPGIHGVQATANDQPPYDFTAGALDLPGTSENLDYPNTALSSDVTAFILVKIPASDVMGILLGGTSVFTFVYRDGSVTAPTSGSGLPTIPTFTLNGASQSWASQDAAHTAINTDQWAIVGIHGADLTATSWRGLILGGYSLGSFFVDGLIGGLVLLDAPSVADQNAALNYLANIPATPITVTEIT